MQKVNCAADIDCKDMDVLRKKRKEEERLRKKEKFKNKEDKRELKQLLTDAKGSSAKKSNRKDETVFVKTIAGEKKDTSKELQSAYSPEAVEDGWFSWWEKQGYFRPEYNEKRSAENFVIVIPPPNVTGILHIGHALTNSIEDAIVRWNRMLGKQTLWLPGTDHAGIATQTVVEKKLMNERKLTRHDIGREGFVSEVWKWKNEKGDRIVKQLKLLGSSCDFSRFRFTMDESMSKAVTEAFIRLYDEGLIYRAKRLVNWSCHLRSAISDIEVEKKEILKRTSIRVPGYDEPVEFGCLVYFAYEIVGENEKIYVATTRIETMLGDTAVAVHPSDERYAHLRNKYVKHPFVQNRNMPIIFDDYVEKELGTGAVKITPAHDHNDYELGLRHNLDVLTIFTDDGRIVDGYGEFSGLKRFDARKAVLNQLKELGLYQKTEDNAMVLRICSKSKDIIEPLIKNQWFLQCKEMANEALNAMKDGRLKLLPDKTHDIIWQRWLENCHDWCISRQLWWGHQIPVYRVVYVDGKEDRYNSDENACWVAGRNLEEAKRNAKKKCGILEENFSLQQDPDVLDTWFSSQLFPFSTMGWPEETSVDFDKFYPGHLLETGHDIIFFWVARMVMIGLKLTGKLPFETVYLHAMVRDAHGKKMSKSLGNVLDPYDVIRGISLRDLQKSLEFGNLDPVELERARDCQAKDFPNGIPQCGTDALRFALINYTEQSWDINLDVSVVHGYRCFCNKIWQSLRYCRSYGMSNEFQPKPIQLIFDQLTSVDRWILSRLSVTVTEMNKSFASYQLSQTTKSIHQFWLYEFCDVYIEYSKQYRDNASIKEIILSVMFECFDTFLRLLHPIMPFITEELFQRLPRRNPTIDEESICVSPYPLDTEYSHLHHEQIENEFNQAMEITRKIRSIRKDRGMLDKTTLFLTVTILDAEFCSRYLDTILLPLSNSSISDNSKVLGELLLENCYLRLNEIASYSELSTSSHSLFDIRSLANIRMTHEQLTLFESQLKIFYSPILSNEENANLLQWCNWLNQQICTRGRIAMKETLEFINRHLLSNTYMANSKYPTMADSLLLHYLKVNEVNEKFLSTLTNINRWYNTIIAQ